MRKKRLHDFLLPKEVANQLGMSTSSLAKHTMRGELRCRRTLGGHRRYRRDEIERLVGELDHNNDPQTGGHEDDEE